MERKRAKFTSGFPHIKRIDRAFWMDFEKKENNNNRKSKVARWDAMKRWNERKTEGGVSE